jgi:hypothetical protein
MTEHLEIDGHFLAVTAQDFRRRFHNVPVQFMHLSILPAVFTGTGTDKSHQMDQMQRYFLDIGNYAATLI